MAFNANSGREFSSAADRVIGLEDQLRQLEAQKRAILLQLEELRQSPQTLQEQPVPIVAPITPAEKIALFLSLFRARESVFPRLWENPKSGKKGYSPVCHNEWLRGVCEKPRVKCSVCPNQNFPSLNEEAVAGHLTGRHTIGTYAIREDNTCIFLAADFDGDGWQEDVSAYRDAAAELGVETSIERSRSGRGAHAWIFFAMPVPASLARRLGTMITAKASSIYPGMKLATYDRFFPNQDTLPDGGFGNLIALPLQKTPRAQDNTVFVDQTLSPIPDQWRYLANIRKVAPEELTRIVETLIPAIDTIAANSSENLSLLCDEKALDLIPEAVTNGVFQKVVLARRREQIEVSTDGLPACLTASLKRLATLANPVFYEKQRLRFPTYNIPRFIFCGAIYPGRLVLPRGIRAEVESLIRKAGGSLSLLDDRSTATSARFAFSGQLTASQSNAVQELLKYEEGVLVAPPGSGKTVMGCAVIAARGVSTLVLVHRKPLLEQWRERLHEFLGIEKSTIRILGQPAGNHDSPVALGMLQTLARSESSGAVLANYTQVIIDECHHVPAASFEAVLKECTARFILGLTATPVRKDGLQKILFLQCGPIRHTIETGDDSAVARKVFVRELLLGRRLEADRLPIHLLWEALVNSHERNRVIADDVATAVRQNRFCAVLSDRKVHLERLENMLRENLGEADEMVFRIDGSLGKKQRRAAFEGLQGFAAEGRSYVLLATSSLLGEGLDLPELDALFLAMPISFKGRLIQYAGRLHRQCSGKTDVRIYDYVDADHPVTIHMHRKRLSVYRQMGYEVTGTPENATSYFDWT